MIIRKLKEEERNEYRKLTRYAFDIRQNNYENLVWPSDKVPIKQFYGAFINEKLVAGLLVMPFELRLRRKFFKMWGIAGVTSKPEFRNRGAIRKIFHLLFQDMENENIPLSVLYPFKFSYYEKVGYYLADETIIHQFRISDINIKNVNPSYFIKEVEDLNDDIINVYEKATENFNYIAKREGFHWRRRVRGNYIFICYNEKQPVGYIFLHAPTRESENPPELIKTGQILYIREVFWLDSDAKLAILKFLWSHRDQFHFIEGTFPVNENIIDILKNPNIIDMPGFSIRKIHPNSQLRIVEVKNIIKTIEYPINNFTLTLRVHDKQCEWNDGDFHIISNEGSVEVKIGEKIEGSPDLEIDVGHLSQLLVGFRSIKELMEFSFIKINQDKLELLDGLFPKTINYFRDVY